MTAIKQASPLVRGTFYLTLTGLLSRTIGFFYRIFLSYAIGAEGMGIYQLIVPVSSLCYSFTAAGIQTSLSRFVASYTARGEHRSALDVWRSGMVLSVCLSALAGIFVYGNASFLAEAVLGEPRCASLLRIMALSLPLESAHACMNGYYYGKKRAEIPALSQLIEQFVRVSSALAIYYALQKNSFMPTVNITIIGVLCGEAAATVFSVAAMAFEQNVKSRMNTLLLQAHAAKRSVVTHMEHLITMAAPLTANRVIINLLAGAEAILLPTMLRASGLDHTEALSVYGILTGMALPLILFPSAVTNSISVMLLPTISEQDAMGQQRAIGCMVKKTLRYCLLLGFGCTLIFLFSGSLLGRLLFHSELAGSFIMTLSFLCPFLYLSSTLTSILHGLGQMARPFLYSLISLGLRLAFIYFAVPVFGIQGYLWGLLAAQFVQAGLDLWALRHYLAVAS